jgi:cytochrome c553
MSNATPDITKKQRPSQPGTPVLVRLQPEQLQRLDGWIAEQEGEKPTRPEAIRRLLDLLLA